MKTSITDSILRVREALTRARLHSSAELLEGVGADAAVDLGHVEAVQRDLRLRQDDAQQLTGALTMQYSMLYPDGALTPESSRLLAQLSDASDSQSGLQALAACLRELREVLMAMQAVQDSASDPIALLSSSQALHGRVVAFEQLSQRLSLA